MGNYVRMIASSSVDQDLQKCVLFERIPASFRHNFGNESDSFLSWYYHRNISQINKHKRPVAYKPGTTVVFHPNQVQVANFLILSLHSATKTCHEKIFFTITQPNSQFLPCVSVLQKCCHSVCNLLQCILPCRVPGIILYNCQSETQLNAGFVVYKKTARGNRTHRLHLSFKLFF